jgi:hypothetical protein
MVESSVLRPGPARRVDPGPGRPGSVAEPGLREKQAGNWPGQTRSARPHPAETRVYFFFISSCPKRRRFGLLQLKGQNNKSRGTNALQNAEQQK